MIGIDEVGRGCWAGPLVAAAVRLHTAIEGLADSKVLSRSKRQKLVDLIQQSADVGIGWVTPQEVDALGLTQAVSSAMERAIANLIVATDEEVIIDGNYNYLPGLGNVSVMVKADSIVPAVSAASIIAKVARDDYMAKLGQSFPQYGFEQHVGYGTKQHVLALEHYGVTDHHRKSYKPIQAFL